MTPATAANSYFQGWREKYPNGLTRDRDNFFWGVMTIGRSGERVGCPSGTCDLNPLGTASRSPGRKDDDIISNVQAFCNAARQIIDRLSRKQTRMTSPCLLPALNNEGKLV